MTNKKKKFYISTAIDYVNAAPHLGHCLEKVQADVLARYRRICGDNVFFLTGTDENSLKNVKAAEKERISPQELVDRNAGKFYQLKEGLNLSFDDFIRTTEQRHIKGAQKLWQSCSQDIYKKNYRGLYCFGCEEFYKENELVNGYCPEHKAKPEIIEEENYFFRLSKYESKIRELIEGDKLKIIPETRKKETITFINQGLKDICISRSLARAKGWGIDVPEDSLQKMWCWIEALSNYITALGYGEGKKEFQNFWQNNENKVHIIGKGILRFHAVYWLGILLSAGLRLPDKIFVHGYLTVNNQKMSKSLGNTIDPFALIEQYGTEPVRYFLLREFSPFEDGDYTYRKFEERYNADLAKGLGNLVARIMNLAIKFKIQNSKFKTTIQNSKLDGFIKETKINCRKFLDDFKFNESLAAIWELISFCDKYIEDERPWEEGEKDKRVINDLLIALLGIAEMLKPFLPKTSEKIEKYIKFAEKPKSLFPRIEPES